MPVHRSPRPSACQPGPDYATHGPETPDLAEVTCSVCRDNYTRQMGDRRQGPRREAERLLHYAEVNLHAAAIAWAAARRQGMDANYLRATRYLEEATETYERAYRQETTPTPPG